MPTVKTYQSHCATPRIGELDQYTKRPAHHNVPSLTERVSRLTLHGGNLALSSKGFSAITQPSRACTCAKPTKAVTERSTVRVSSQNLNNVQKATAVKKTPLKFLVPGSLRSKSASRHTNSNQLDSKTKSFKSSDDISKKHDNICTSKRIIANCGNSKSKEESPLRLGTGNSNYRKYFRFTKASIVNSTNTDVKNDLTRQTSSSCEIQLLHPDWRRVPWKSHFGWTESHQELTKLLRCEVGKGAVESMYYSSEESHALAEARWRTRHADIPFLAGPSVTSVADVLAVLRRMSEARLRSVYPCRTWWSKKSSSELSEYDADDED